MTQITKGLLYELKVENLPPNLANNEFIHYLTSTHNIENPVLVHTQLINNQKILILRLRQKEIFQHLDSLTEIYKGHQIRFSSYYRTITKQINKALKKTGGIVTVSDVPHYYKKISTVHLNNVPFNLKAPPIRKVMERFGGVEQIRIYEKGELKEKNRTKCRICTVTYLKFEDAVDAYYQDKIKIGGSNLKVKLYIHRNFDKSKEKFSEGNNEKKVSDWGRTNKRGKDHDKARFNAGGLDDRARQEEDERAKEERVGQYDHRMDAGAAQFGSKARHPRRLQPFASTFEVQQRRQRINQDQVIPTSFGGGNYSRGVSLIGDLIPVRPSPAYRSPPNPIFQNSINDLLDRKRKIMQNLIFLLESKSIEKFKYKQGLSLVLVKERHIAENLRYNRRGYTQSLRYLGIGPTSQQLQTPEFENIGENSETRKSKNFALKSLNNNYNDNDEEDRKTATMVKNEDRKKVGSTYKQASY